MADVVNSSEYKQSGNQEEFWDLISEDWKSYRGKEIDCVVNFLKDKKGKIIDLGCGSGRNFIKNEYLEFIGVDFSKEMLKYAKEKAMSNGINVRLFKKEFERIKELNFVDKEFDYGLFIGALHCIESNEDRLRVLKELYRILKKNGEVLITVWDKNNERFRNKDKDVYVSWIVKNEKVYRYYRLFDKEELIELLERAGFEVLKIYDPIDGKDRFSRRNLIIKIRKP